MPLLQAYTISFINRECEKVCIDFADPSPSDYELAEILDFFRRYKKETFIDHEDNQIRFIVVKWEHWVEFLLELGFEATGRAIGEILEDLRLNYEITMEEWVDQLKHAKPITEPYKEKSVVVCTVDEDDHELLKKQEIRRLQLNRVRKEQTKEDHEFNIRRKLKTPFVY